MLLTEYLAGFAKAIDEYSKTGLILSSELKIDVLEEIVSDLLRSLE
jgi:hypothetical protein